MDLRFVFLLAVLGVVQSKLSCSTIKKIVDGHNSRRQLLVQGNVENQPAARKMNIMVWDDQLAVKAAAWASNNNFTHNPNRYIDSPNFSTTGENLYQYSTTASKLNFDPEMALTPWFDEHKDFTFKPLAWEDFGKSPPVGHYTQMVWSDTTYVGCGLSRFKKGSWSNILFVCNYGPTGNYVGETPYLTGTGSGRLHCSIDDCSQKYGDRCTN